ncbi:hypothetical protein C8J56DRAFT_1160457 [Mycena floridula]|nr:hypothetical protein C8J56DRAFT_1160457 [Mycena floridula]
MASTVEENLSDNRIVASCGSCTYEFRYKPLPSVIDSTPQNPIPFDTEAIRSFISDAEEEVTRCSDEISCLRAIIDQVKEHRAEVSRQISVHRPYIAPIRRLPGKLLALIFSFFCAVDIWDCEPFSDLRIVASCSSCTYEFLSKPSPSVVDSKRQNPIPSGTEAIRSFIFDAEEEVTRCSDEISRLCAIIDQVKEHQAEVSRQISVHQPYIAPIRPDIAPIRPDIIPIRRLPGELLALIFSFFCTVDFWNCKPFNLKKWRMRGSLFREPFIIATVCSLWRGIAVSTPSLWTTIMLGGDRIERSREEYEEEYPDSDSSARMFPEDVLEVALERSAQHPLKLWIERFTGSHWPQIFTTKLRQICPRIEQIHLGGDSDPLERGRLGSQSLVFDQLSAVRVQRDCYMERPTASNLRLLIMDVKNIWKNLPFSQSTRYLFIQADEYHTIPRAISRFSQVPNFISSGLIGKYADGITLNLSHCESPQSLRHFSVRITCFERRCNTDPKLGHLSHFKWPCHCLRNLLSALTLPRLKSLQIIGEGIWETRWSPDESYFSAFIQRSAITETLTTFSLHGIGGLDDKKFAKVLQSMPFLERLIVSAFRKKPIISTTMLQQLAAGPLIPRLKILDLHIDITIEAANAIVQLVGARSSPRGNLEDIVMRMPESGMKELPETSETILRLQDELKGFPGTRHLISRAPGPSYLGFDDWID